MKEISILTRLKILLVFKVFMCFIVTFYFDLFFGIILFILAIFVGVCLFMLKYKGVSHAKELFADLHIALGGLMILGVIIFILFFRSNDLIRIILKSFFGVLLVLKGSYVLYKTHKLLK